MWLLRIVIGIVINIAHWHSRKTLILKITADLAYNTRERLISITLFKTFFREKRFLSKTLLNFERLFGKNIIKA